MAKKYRETRKDRMDESKGMKRRLDKGRGGSFVTGHDPEIGRGDFSGMPRETIMASYPPNRARQGGYLDDTMSEIDAIQTDSERQVERHLSHQK